MSLHDITPEMKKTLLRLIKKGYTYYRHTDDRECIISLGRHRIGSTSKYAWSIHFLDYNNYGKYWVTVLDPKDIIDDFYNAFKFERKLDVAWLDTMNKI